MECHGRQGEGYAFKAIVTNKTTGVKHILAFHNGRGAQEAIIADLKIHCHQDYVPVKTLNGNKVYLLAGVIAHNLYKESPRSNISSIYATLGATI